MMRFGRLIAVLFMVVGRAAARLAQEILTESSRELNRGSPVIAPYGVFPCCSNLSEPMAARGKFIPFGNFPDGVKNAIFLLAAASRSASMAACDDLTS
jgi:hypothetical protein